MNPGDMFNQSEIKGSKSIVRIVLLSSITLVFCSFMSIDALSGQTMTRTDCPAWKCSIDIDKTFWSVETRRMGPGGSLLMHPRDAPDKAEIFLTLRPRQPGEETPKQAFEHDSRRIALIYGRLTIHRQSSKLIAGVPGHEVLFDAGGKTFLRYTLQAGPYTILLGLSSDKDKFPVYRKRFKDIAKTFKLPDEVTRNAATSPFATHGRAAARVIGPPVYAWPLDGELMVSPEIEVSGGDRGMECSGVRVAARSRRSRALFFKWIEGNELAYRYSMFGPLGDRAHFSTIIPARGRGVLFLPRIKLPPGFLKEGCLVRVRIIGEDESQKNIVTSIRPRKIPRNSLLAFPMTGTWRVVRGPSDGNPLRRSLEFFNDRFYLCHRFALDLVKVDARGERPKRAARNRDYPAFKEKVMAPASGTIVQVRSDMADNPPGSNGADPPLGNMVRMKIAGTGYYLVLGHLASGSIHVKPGDKVEKGSLIALVGNSGRSTEPHLRMEVYSGESPYCQGVPALFEKIMVPEPDGKWRAIENTCLDSGWVVRRSE
ncbi:MAG: M23 family metallopeptidase [Deltaproteobacteria bacterium]|nr:M23 family metallopeptidase [Deltaproteobacteria bacterium]